MDEQNYNGGARGRVATEFALVTEAFMAPRGGARALEGVSCANVLLMHAWCDNYVDPIGSVAFFERATCADSKALLLSLAATLMPPSYVLPARPPLTPSSRRSRTSTCGTRSRRSLGPSD